MPYVYRYKDKNDDVIKYVGIIKKESNFPQRFKQHKSDDWAGEGDWEISYIKVPTITDAEMLEAHFIALYETDAYYNKAKSSWGACSFAPSDVDWVVFTDKYENPNDEIWRVLNEITKCALEAERLSRKAHLLAKEIDKEKRKSVREWFKFTFECMVPKEYRCAYTLESCFDNYQSYAEYIHDEFNENPYEFEDVSEFTEALYDSSVTQPWVTGDSICGVIQKGSELHEKYESEMLKKQADAMESFSKRLLQKGNVVEAN